MSTNDGREDAGIFTVEGNVAGGLAAKLAQQREKQRSDFETKKRKIEEEATKKRVKRVDDKFTKKTVGDPKLAAATYGLKTRDEFVHAKKLQKAAEGKPHGSTEEQGSNDIHKPAKKKKKKTKKLKPLSFGVDDDDDDDDNDGDVGDTATVVTKKISKNPHVKTDFLPDREREEANKAKIKQLTQEWWDAQDKIKQEKVEVTYSYWDGSGHRRTISIEKGATIGTFLERVRHALTTEFPELRGVSSESLLYVKEDLIIPHSYSFYDLIVSKARGKSGPLFKFDVHDDVRIRNDVRIEKDESHPGKICERHWFERNKHIFPASRWEMYDPNVIRDKYTIGGDIVRGNKN